MFHTNRMATAYRENMLLPAERAETIAGYHLNRSRRALNNPLTHVMTRLANLWHVLGRLRKVRVEVTFDLNEPNFDSVTR